MPDFSEANCKIFVSGVESLSCLPLNFKVVDVDECDDEKCLPSAVGNVQLDVKWKIGSDGCGNFGCSKLFDDFACWSELYIWNGFLLEGPPLLRVYLDGGFVLPESEKINIIHVYCECSNTP